jgi:hypothetical protein
MGAAIAAMVAYQAVVRYPVFRMRLYLVLLGSPRFARRTFTAWLNSELRYRILQCAPSLSPPPPHNHHHIIFFTWASHLALTALQYHTRWRSGAQVPTRSSLRTPPDASELELLLN